MCSPPPTLQKEPAARSAAAEVWDCLVHDPGEFSAQTYSPSSLGPITSHIPKTVQHKTPLAVGERAPQPMLGRQFVETGALVLSKV